MNRIHTLVASLLLASTGTATALGSNTWYVSTTGNDSNPGTQAEPFQHIRYAVSNPTTISGDTIQIAAGTYKEGLPIKIDGMELSLIGDVDGEGKPTSILDGEDSVRVLECSVGVTNATLFKNLVIQRGKVDSDNGAGMLCDNGSSPTLINCTFQNNNADSGGAGGGISCSINSHPILTDCTFTNNKCYEDGSAGGAINLDYSNVTASNCTFSYNSADYGGGISMYNSNSTTLTGCTFTNQLANYAGAIQATLSKANVTDCIITGNTGVDGASGIYTNFLTISGGKICGNTTDQIQGTFTMGTSTPVIADHCPTASGDLDADGDVDTDDLNTLHTDLGICKHDTNHNGVTDIDDLLDVVEGWNITCGP